MFKIDKKLRLKQTTTVGNVTFINEAARYHFIAMQASNRALARVTCPALLGDGDVIMTMEAYEVIDQAAQGLKLDCFVQAIDVDDALILCDLPMTKEDIMAIVYPERLQETAQ